MALIKQVVEKALCSGYLTSSAEEQLRRLFNQGCDLDDIEALNQLQQAVVTGVVKRQQGNMETHIAEDRS